MDILLKPSRLSGAIEAPPSKSAAHRLIIAAALSQGESLISNIALSDDIRATIDAVRALGAEVRLDGDKAFVKGITDPPAKAQIDCRESGSTLRFMIPAAAALGVTATFSGRGNLPNRPITPYVRELSKKGISFDYDGSMPFKISGKLTPGVFELEGDISSQFVTGLLFGLGILNGESEIRLLSPLQSRPYAEMTVAYLKQFGARITESEAGFRISGGSLKALDVKVEGDYSQAAFFMVSNALGSDVAVTGLDPDSPQGDKKIADILKDTVDGGRIKPFSIDCSDIPDLVPILSVLACFADGKSEIKNAARLRIKECDRLAAMEENLNRLGGRVSSTEDSLTIEGVKSLFGGSVDSFGDHRIAMSMTIASQRVCGGNVLIKGAECVSKSFPDFFEKYKILGGR